MRFLPQRVSPCLQGVLLYGLCFAVLSFLIFAAPGFFGTDDYYHARMGTEIITQGRLALDFVWLPKTILSQERFADHHLLYHLYIAPWTTLWGMTGAKLATVSIAAGVFAAIWWLLRQVGVRYVFLWTLALFATSVPFFFRLLMIRTQGASLLLLLLALSLLFARRYRWLLPLAFAYVWLYNGFVLILALAGLSLIATWITEKRLDWQPVVYTAFGLALGLIINPYFPQNLQFISDHLGAKVDLESSVRVGNEWYPYTTGVLLANSGGALLALGLGFLAPSFRQGHRDRSETTLLFAALLTLLMVFQSRRFIEYFPAFALLFAAAAWGRGPGLLANWQSGFLIPLHWAIRLGTVAIVSLFVYGTLTQVYHDAQATQSPEYLAGAATWLRENTPAGTMIFQTDWDDFTRLFYYNTQNVYLVGLDPTYLEIADSQLWQQWVAITQGKIAQPSEVIQSEFGASYIVSDNGHDNFIRRANQDPNLERVYQDQFSSIWHISEAVTAQTGE
ncbi:MAG TPA: hypothetical protein VHO69_06660 [Phototrophicaceae bacterium]|nr:hypothetical protein [Phototrophicaceae bacterium]